MSTPNNRRRDPGGLTGEVLLLWVAILLVVLVVGSVYAAMHLGHAIAGTGLDVSADPFTVLFDLLSGDLAWPGAPGSTPNRSRTSSMNATTRAVAGRAPARRTSWPPTRSRWRA